MFLTLFKLVKVKRAVKCALRFVFPRLELTSPHRPGRSVREPEPEPRRRLRWSCGAGAGAGCSDCPASADVYRPNDFREAPTDEAHNRMADGSKTSSAGPEARTGAAEPAGPEPGVQTGSRSSRTRNVAMTTRENTSLIRWD